MMFLTSFICIAALFPSVLTLTNYPSVPLDLQNFLNNQAASPDGSADFDGHGASFDSAHLPPGPWIHDGITYNVPAVWGKGLDNMIADGQNLSLSKPEFVHELHFLYTGDASGNEFVKTFILTFDDSSTQQIQFVAKNWWKWAQLNNGEIQTPYHFENHGAQKNFNSSEIFQWSTSIPSERALKAINFPLNNPSHRLHIFGMAISPSLQVSRGSGSHVALNDALSVRRARFTTRWETVKNTRAQAVEVSLANLFPSHTTSKSTALTEHYEIRVTGAGISTVTPGIVNRLVPGDQARVDVLVVGSEKAGDKKATVQVVDSRGSVVGTSEGWAVQPLVETWTPDQKVLSQHETPTWWNKAKYGIFIHWGVYSSPAWAPSNSYAEWYDWNLHNPPDSDSPTWNHHLQTYGKDVVYDDFIANFTASKFNASEWVDLFDRAGAKYFVLVTKHHDGFALFDTGETTHRSSVFLGPRKDFVRDLLDTAKREKPNLHRGTYYSLPEWFNPDYAQYGFAQWPGGLAHNAFSPAELEPYTGHLNITDYLTDLQLPHMLDLAKTYDTEIMWCDIGGPNKTLDFAAEFYNHASKQDRQVTINNRCGGVSDFDTPEYATFGAIQPRSWESNEGMDPFSYGLDSATSASQYKNGTTIIQTLVDITSKNGNFLLDIGPTAEGEIIAPMQENLLDAGEWLGYSGECVYDTDYWFPGSEGGGTEDAPSMRFLTTPTTFCIVSFGTPINGTLIVRKRLPILPGDEIRLLRPIAPSSPLRWTLDDQTGETIIEVPESELDGTKFAWAFQVKYNIK